MKEKTNPKTWFSTDLALLGCELWRKENYGHSLLIIVGSQLGLKIGTLLKLKWSDVIELKEKKVFFEEIIVTKEGERPINETLGNFLGRAFIKLKIKNLEDLIFINYKSGKALTTASLNRDLKKHSYLVQSVIPHPDFPRYSDLKTKDIELAWARDEIKSQGYTKQAYIEVSRFLRHKNTQYTIDLLGMEVVEKRPMRFDYLHDEGLIKNLKME